MIFVISANWKEEEAGVLLEMVSHYSKEKYKNEKS